MSINNIGRINDHLKTANLEIKWQQRKNSPFIPDNPNKKEENTITSLIKQNEETQKTETMQRIDRKLKTGKKLSVAEMDYLRKNAPDLYAKAVKIETEREEYRRALSRCKTKEEAEQLHTEKTMMLLAESSAVAGNPYIPKERKQELLEFTAMRAAALNNEFYEHMQQ